MQFSPLYQALQQVQKVQGVPQVQEVHGHHQSQEILVYQALPKHNENSINTVKKLLWNWRQMLYCCVTHYRDKKSWPHCPVSVSLHWLSISFIIDYKIMIRLWISKHVKMLCFYMSDRFDLAKDKWKLDMYIYVYHWIYCIDMSTYGWSGETREASLSTLSRQTNNTTGPSQTHRTWRPISTLQIHKGQNWVVGSTY